MNTYYGCIVREENGFLVAMLTDRKILDEVVIERLEGNITQLADDNPDIPILFDISGVDFMSSLMLNTWAHLNNRFRKEDRKWGLCCMQDNLRDVLHITGLDKVLPMYSSIEDAIAATTA